MKAHPIADPAPPLIRVVDARARNVTALRTHEGARTTLKLFGVLDAASFAAVQSLLDAVVEERPAELAIELGGLRLVDGRGLAAIVTLYKRISSQGGNVRILGLRDQPLALFRLMRLDRHFPLV